MSWVSLMLKCVAALCAFALATLSPAHADEIVLRADAPIVDVTINGKPARMLVDALLPDLMVLNPETKNRLDVHPAPVISARAVFDDASVRAQIARPRVEFANGKSSRAFTGLFGGLWSHMEGVDGAMGPGVLPYDRVRIILRDGDGGTVRSFHLPRAKVWLFDTDLLGEPASVGFRLSTRESMLNRPAAQYLDDMRQLTLEGGTERREFFLGLSATVQRARTDVRVSGFAIGDVIARTASPLAGAEGVDVVPVLADPGKPRRRTVTLGREALASCYDIVWEQAESVLKIRCDS